MLKSKSRKDDAAVVRKMISKNSYHNAKVCQKPVKGNLNKMSVTKCNKKHINNIGQKVDPDRNTNYNVSEIFDIRSKDTIE